MKTCFLTCLPVAHRGLHDESFPENSYSAFENAVKHGYAIETDVRPTKDGRLVLFHDDNLLRLCGIDREVIDCTAEELRAFTLLGTQEKIPFLSEFLLVLDGRAPLLLELKSARGANKKQFVKAVAQAFEGYSGEYAVQSFHPYLVKGYKKLRPKIDCGILATAQSKKGDFSRPFTWKIQAWLVKNMFLNGWVKPNFISYHAPDLPVRNPHGLPLLAWTVRSQKEEEQVRKYAQNIIFEGYLPDLLQ